MNSRKRNTMHDPNTTQATQHGCLVDVTKQLATGVLATRLFVIKNTSGSGEDDDTEPTGRKEQVYPGLDLVRLDVVARRDHASLVETTVQLDDNLARAVVIDDLELADIAMTLHDRKELHNHLRGGTDQHLALTAALGIDNVVKTVVKDGDANHLDA